MKGISDLLGRIFISFIFFYEGLDTFFNFSSTLQTMTEYGITWNQKFLLGMVLFLMFLGAILVALGYYARFGAFLLLLYWLPYTCIIYSFWNDPPDLQRLNAIYFMRNLGVIGGLLLLMANGAGEYSIKRLIHVMRLPK